MPRLDRRAFVKGMSAGALSFSVAETPAAVSSEGQALSASRREHGTLAPSKPHPLPDPGYPRFWIDDQRASLPSRPWRKVHLDFHNSQYVGHFGEKFNPDEFGDRLLEANVNAIVVFAKDMHGYFYYPSKSGPVHPGLSSDLLGEQVVACRQRKIAVFVVKD
jgi:hypothetical protein